MKKAFPLIDFCCWSTVQFNPFAQHLIAQPTILLYAESDTLDTVADALKLAGWDAWANPKQRDVERFVHPGEKTVVSRPAMVEGSKLQLMDPGEIQRILDSVLRTGIIQLPVIIGYSEIRGIDLMSEEITH